MTWSNKYWDIIDQLYWTPRYLGMRSISQKHWQMQDGFISIPAKLVNKAGPLYSRERKISDLKAYLHGQEEILNHIFDITFSIAPDSMINDILLNPLGFNDSGPFESIGCESATRYGWGELDNVTQHDGLFVSEQSAVGVELKLQSKSWPEQIVKYVALLSWEELLNGPRQQLGLLFIVPDSAIKNHWQKCGLDGAFVNQTFIETKWKSRLPQAILNLFDKHHDYVASVLDRMKLCVISWEELRHRMVTLQASLDPSQRGDQTLGRLIGGFLAQLEVHRDTGLHQSPNAPRLFRETSEVQRVKNFKGASSRRAWNEVSFFEDTVKRLSEEQVTVIRKLFEFSKQNAQIDNWGTGNASGSFSPKFMNVSRRSPFTIRSDGTLKFKLSWLDDSEEALRFREIYQSELRKVGIVVDDKREKDFGIMEWSLWADKLVLATQEAIKNYLYYA